MIRFKLLFFLLSFTVFATAATAYQQPHNSTSGNVTAMEVKEQMAGKSKVVIIDVRSMPEYKYGHIPGAINIPSPAVKMLPNRLPKDKSTLIIMYGRGDSFIDIDRAFNAAYKMGYTNLKRFSGGILEWMDNHYPVKKGTRP